MSLYRASTCVLSSWWLEYETHFWKNITHRGYLIPKKCSVCVLAFMIILKLHEFVLLDPSVMLRLYSVARGLWWLQVGYVVFPIRGIVDWVGAWIIGLLHLSVDVWSIFLERKIWFLASHSRSGPIFLRWKGSTQQHAVRLCLLRAPVPWIYPFLQL